MRRTACVAILASFIVCIASVPVLATDFRPIFPKQAQKMVAPPNFTWATGDYDFFVLLVLAPIPGHWYQPIVIPQAKSFFLMPEEWWEAMVTDGRGLWFVLGMNTSAWDYSVTPWQYFHKVTDCEVQFPDPNLDAEIRWQIEKPNGPILASDLSAVISLEVFAPGGDIIDLHGLEYCVNLSLLNIGGGAVEDLTPLAGIVDLWAFGVLVDHAGFLCNPDGPRHDLPIVDPSPIAGLQNLGVLAFYPNPITDLTPLGSLSNLQALGLVCGEVEDITPLGGLSQLEMLSLAQNEISDLSPLAMILSLSFVHLGDNEISDVSPLVEYFSEGRYDEGVDLYGNPLSTTSCEVTIPILEGWGVPVWHDCP